MRVFTVVVSTLLSCQFAYAVECQITGQGQYNNPPGEHVDFLCTLDPNDVSNLTNGNTRAVLAYLLNQLQPGGTLLAIEVDRRIQQIQDGANANGALFKATVVNGNYLREFIAHGR